MPRRGKVCGKPKSNGQPCQNHVIDPPCWLHQSHLTIPVTDSRMPNVVKAFKCPHCHKLTELVERYA